MKVGILGGGQLALMMVDSFIDKNVEFIVLDPSDKPPASKRVKCIKAKYDDTEYLDFLAKECDVVTIDFENVPSSSLNYLEMQTKVYEIGMELKFPNLKDWFSGFYQVILGQEQGPRLGSFIKFYGLKQTIELLKEKVN